MKELIDVSRASMGQHDVESGQQGLPAFVSGVFFSKKFRNVAALDGRLGS